MAAPNWATLILDTPQPAVAWKSIFDGLATWSGMAAPNDIEDACAGADRLLADAAWDLWSAYAIDPSCAALRTSAALGEWWNRPGPPGRAVLILDAMSLRELPVLFNAAEARKLPTALAVSGAEVPSDTNRFAQALGVASRANLANNGASAGFAFGSAKTQVFESIPFVDCVNEVGYDADLFFWHDLIDAKLHECKTQAHVQRLVQQVRDALQSEGFWQLVDRMRQGRRLVITSDHGYALRMAAARIEQPSAGAIANILKASRSVKASEPLTLTLLPPSILTANGYHCLVGNRQWPVAGGFPEISHGGLTLLEIAVPFIEFTAA